MTVTVPCSGCCTGGGGGGGNQPGCPPGGSCKIDPHGTGGGSDTDHCVSGASYALEFQSRNGSGCLTGYSEFLFGTPSNPPVKYLTKTFNGTLGEEATCGGIGCAGCNSDYAKVVYSGSNNYSPTTGVLTQGAIGHHSFNGSGCSGGTVGDSVIESLTDVPIGNADYTICPRIVSHTRINGFMGDIGCTPGSDGCFPTHSGCGGYYTFRYGSATEILSNLDSFENALIRAGVILGTESSAILGAFTGFCTTGQTSHWICNFTGLNPACSYRFTVTYVRDTVGGGTETLTDETDFSPEGSTYVLEGDVPAVVDLNTFFGGSLLQFIT